MWRTGRERARGECGGLGGREQGESVEDWEGGSKGRVRRTGRERESKGRVRRTGRERAMGRVRRTGREGARGECGGLGGREQGESEEDWEGESKGRVRRTGRERARGE